MSNIFTTFAAEKLKFIVLSGLRNLTQRTFMTIIFWHDNCSYPENELLND